MDAWLLENLHADEPVVALWQNAPTIIVGQSQNTWAEVNLDYVKEQQLPVMRRVTGGGAVYHDLGNLCFTLILPVANSGSVDFSTFVKPVVKALHNMGIPAEATGRNDLVIEGKKISGNTQRYQNGYLIHHGTLLFDSDVDAMVHALNATEKRLDDAGIKNQIFKKISRIY
ncbi:lipoate--protein ligase family protein [Pediococcus acidilactici]|uniref:lipoate--protein ligase family protein n=1 Tax=Pediococcus acidilactici TaxID=1254 RepID=UPI00190F6DC0